jgi:tyrosine-protein kinase Etk/Wzc
MEPEHLRFIATMAPENRGKSLLFGQWLETRDIPDPYQKVVKPMNMFSSNWESQSGMGSSFESTRNEAVMSSSKSDKYSAATPQNNEIDLLQLLAEMFDHRVTIACVTLLLTVCAGIYAFSATPVYQADALVQVEAKQNNSLLKNLTPFGPDLSPDVAPELLLLKSRMILGETVDQLGLTYNVKRVFPVIGPLWEHVQGRKSAEITIGALTIPFWKVSHKRFYSPYRRKGDIVLREKRLKQTALWGAA